MNISTTLSLYPMVYHFATTLLLDLVLSVSAL